MTTQATLYDAIFREVRELAYGKPIFWAYVYDGGRVVVSEFPWDVDPENWDLSVLPIKRWIVRKKSLVEVMPPFNFTTSKEIAFPYAIFACSPDLSTVILIVQWWNFTGRGYRYNVKENEKGTTLELVGIWMRS